jgi:hypothetical protein
MGAPFPLVLSAPESRDRREQLSSDTLVGTAAGSPVVPGPKSDNGAFTMDRTASSTQTTTPFSYESLPNEIHQMILSQIPEVNSPAGRPTVRSVSCVNQQLHAIAMPFLMECYVSMMEIALPAFSSEKKVNTLIQLKNWLATHAEQMPTNAYIDALKRTQKLTDGLTPAELQLFLPKIEPSFSTSLDAPSSVNDMIAMQMSFNSYYSVSDQLTAHHRDFSNQLEKLCKDL